MLLRWKIGNSGQAAFEIRASHKLFVKMYTGVIEVVSQSPVTVK